MRQHPDPRFKDVIILETEEEGEAAKALIRALPPSRISKCDPPPGDVRPELVKRFGPIKPAKK